ncbi:hypothetical protein EI42_00473 [Thermosporothrix hazakensis]|uniref:Uncharacterized protein n=2 Tax=Thermosporothrix TaxID=768650 RepID=A0A326UQE8_THEHA|nr:hypothetical protein [Thermosporothrix hazakensis]PZW36299.1 hypothetical protein EI42_00473 [Thermosporothrix hazakensis]BBH88765.1 hypothetical protein KTC_35160 [Thermosporothrix sp. COM3]GCE46949.1 hypothetical protein KTH_18180 [Thermosporothrix hazakensis]
MTTDKNGLATITCPRCGGTMIKPAGSTFYWHASANHPPCTITNIPEGVYTTTSGGEADPVLSSSNEESRIQS